MTATVEESTKLEVIQDTSIDLKPRLNKDFIKNINGKEFVLFAGLLSIAHQKGLKELTVEILQYPGLENGNTTICKAKAVTKDGEIFSDIGDANPLNTDSFIAVHSIRMASTRSLARTLRSLTNIGLTCLEELGDFNEVIGRDGNGNGGNGNKEFTNNYTHKKSGNGNGNGNGTATNHHDNRNKNNESVAPMIKKSGNNGGGNAPKTYYQACVKKYNSPKDSVNGNGKNGGNGHTALMSEAQKRAMLNLSKRRKISENELEALAKKQFGVSVENLSSQDASQFIRLLQKSA